MADPGGDSAVLGVASRRELFQNFQSRFCKEDRVNIRGKITMNEPILSSLTLIVTLVPTALGSRRFFDEAVSSSVKRPKEPGVNLRCQLTIALDGDPC